jgi:hypothetical protein
MAFAMDREDRERKIAADLAQVAAAGVWADGGADLVFGSGLEYRRLLPCRLARGHLAAGAQAFLRARISAVLFSRAI